MVFDDKIFVKFSELEIGDCFLFNQRFFIKIPKMFLDNGTVKNIIDLENGNAGHCCDNISVIRVRINGEVILGY